jgi:hypothetical protein
MSMNGTVCAVVLACGLMNPTVARSVCFDECAPTPPPTTTQHGAGSEGQSTATLEWEISSNFPQKSAIKFYSETRRGHEWPSATEMWLLNDHATHKFRLGCVRGEKICFGAWSTAGKSTSWGVGHGGTFHCSDCCHTCGDNARPQVLEP